MALFYEEQSQLVEQIRDWMQNEAEFKGNTDSKFILKFLVVCSFDVEATKQRIIQYYKIRKRYPGTMKNRDFQDEKIMKLVNQGFLTRNVYENESEFTTVVITDFSRLQSDDELKTAMKLMYLSWETLLNEDLRHSKHGDDIIVNFGGMPMSVLLQIGPTTVKEAIECGLVAPPGKVNNLYIINAGVIMAAVVKLIRLFLPAHLKNILRVYSGSWDSLDGLVPKHCLPIESGGTMGNKQENIERYRQSLSAGRDALLEDEQYGFSDDDLSK